MVSFRGDAMDESDADVEARGEAAMSGRPGTETEAPGRRHEATGHGPPDGRGLDGPGGGDDNRARLVAGLPVTERRLEAAGVPTAVLEGGDGPPVVLLHGPGESALWWLRVIPDLVTTHRVVAPDLPAHGASGSGDGPLDADRVLDWLGELIRRTCPSPPTLVGHLLGGGVAARFAVRREERIGRLVLVDAMGLRWLRPSPRFALALIRFLVRPTERSYDRFLPHCMYDPDALEEEMGERWEPFIDYNLERARAEETREGMRALMLKFGLPAIPREELDGISVPTHLIWGRHDKAIPLRVAEDAHSRYGWPLHVIDEARDDPKLERPEAFLGALRAALGSS